MSEHCVRSNPYRILPLSPGCPAAPMKIVLLLPCARTSMEDAYASRFRFGIVAFDFRHHVKNGRECV